MERQRARADASRDEALLGSRARWGRVGYAGHAFAPAIETYPCVVPAQPRMTTVQDSGRARNVLGSMANLHPLLAAALYEVAFALEAGPLSTWTN